MNLLGGGSPVLVIDVIDGADANSFDDRDFLDGAEGEKLDVTVVEQLAVDLDVINSEGGDFVEGSLCQPSEL